MTKVYFVRHAQPEHTWQEDRTRPLTKEGRRDCSIVLDFLRDKNIDAFYCSPYKRSMDTIADAAAYFGKEIITDERLRERERGSGYNVLRSSHEVFQKQWADHDWRQNGGESVAMVQNRNMEALDEILSHHADGEIVVGTHGVALSSILNFYDPEFGCDDFLRIIDWMPYIIELDFEEGRLTGKYEHCHVEKEFKYENYSIRNKRAWEYNAYEFWLKQSGTPADRAKRDLENPVGMLKRYSEYFDTYSGIKIANICGSCGKKAVPLAVLGAEVTVFDISEHNKKYALEVAAAAKVDLNFEVCDVLEMDLGTYGNYFDVVFMEGGVLHYFHDLDRFMGIMYAILKNGGKMICSDFHPFTKISDILDLEQPVTDYFSTEIFEGEMAYARFFEQEIRERMPGCMYRKYTVSEIINSVIDSGFDLKRFDEHPAWTNEKLPGEFTIVAGKGAD